MAQTGYTPIQIYSSSTGGNTPSAANMTNSALGSELAINIADGKLFYKDSGGSVQVIGWKVVPTTAGGTGLTTYTAGDTLYYASGTTLSKLGIGSSGYYMSSSGTAPQWSAPAALTAGNDTNVTLTVGGSASTALLNAASITAGWTGTLATTRGGTGLSSFTANGVLYASSSSALTTGTALQFDGNNLGVGTTPAAWYSTYAKAIQIGNLGAAISGFTSSLTSVYYTNITNNSYYQSDFNFHAFSAINGGALYQQSGNNHIFATAPAVAAGAAQTFTTAFTIDSNNNFVQGVAAKGINFTANSAAAGMTSQLLNWYEEGTWTPGIAFGGGSTGVTYNTTYTGGKYTRIGNKVFVTGYLIISNKGSSTGNATITGLPYTSTSGAKNYLSANILFEAAVTFTGSFGGRITPSATSIDLIQYSTAGSLSFMNDTNFSNGATIYIAAHYSV
jgi:hypothetical protein